MTSRPTVAERDRLKKEIEVLKAAQQSSAGLTIQTNNVPVVAQGSYVDLTYATEDLDTPRLYNIGDGRLVLTLGCGDAFTFDGVKLGEAVFAANLQGVTDEELIPGN